jgi:hypothetical protein
MIRAVVHEATVHLQMMQRPVGRASVPAAFGGTGLQPVPPHRQNAGVTGNFSEESFMSLRLNRELRKVVDGHITNLVSGTLNFSGQGKDPRAYGETTSDHV